MVKEPESTEPGQETSEERLAEALEEANRREESPWTPIWKGMLFGIGSTVGLALALYLLALVFQTVSGLPIIGSFLDATIGPSIEQTLETRGLVPSTSPTSSTSSAPSATSSISGSSKVSTSYFSVTMPAGWDVKFNETSELDEKVKLVTESDDHSETHGAELTVNVLDTDPGEPLGIKLIETKSISVDGIEGTYYRYTNLSIGNEACYVRLEQNGLIYGLMLSYWPTTYSIGPEVFDDILASFQFKD